MLKNIKNNFVAFLTGLIYYYAIQFLKKIGLFQKGILI